LAIIFGIIGNIILNSFFVAWHVWSHIHSHSSVENITSMSAAISVSGDKDQQGEAS